ncbi:MAG: DUF933 domain-containing protein [Fimbriimonadaceae bacterium]|nr:DUF933 domain-containing protein [Fimbriimonadaceae bacterium]
MKVGLIGYAGVGKTTLYHAAARGQAKGDITAVPVPDERFERIVEAVKPKKASPATVLLHDDLDDIGTEKKAFSQRFLDAARRMDLLLHVVRSFDSPMAPFAREVNPMRDHAAIEDELVLTDLQIVESRIERLTKSVQAQSPGSAEYTEREVLRRIVGPLGEGTPLRLLQLSEEEEAILRNFQFLSQKPLIVAYNVDEADAASVDGSLQEQMGRLRESGVPAFAVCATLEQEIAELEESDQSEFLESLGLQEPASSKVIRAAYDAMGLITFYTAGENETKAWPLRRGSNALKAAATIHNEIAKGFIRAEVVSYEDWAEHGSLSAAHKAGRMRLEGKEYVVQDGELLVIRNKS